MGLGLRVHGIGLKVKGLRFMFGVKAYGFRVQDLVNVKVLEFRVKGFRVYG